MDEKVYLTSSDTETEAVGAALAEHLRAEGRTRAFVALFGEMGVGKTAFTRGFCRALGVTGVHSPTFTVVNEYHTGSIPVFHFDMYRIEEEDELYSIGFDDYLMRDGYALCEWSEHVLDALPTDRVEVLLCRTDDDCGRKITLRKPEERKIP